VTPVPRLDGACCCYGSWGEGGAGRAPLKEEEGKRKKEKGKRARKRKMVRMGRI
jgi:hypothetical protein